MSYIAHTQYVTNDNGHEAAQRRTKLHEVSNHYILWTNWINKLQNKTIALL